MATYVEKYGVLIKGVRGHVLWQQAYAAVLKAASDIRTESGSTDNHANRLIWGLATEQDPESAVNEMKVRIMENATIAADPEGASDNDVQFVVNSLVDYYATGA